VTISFPNKDSAPWSYLDERNIHLKQRETKLFLNKFQAISCQTVNIYSNIVFVISRNQLHEKSKKRKERRNTSVHTHTHTHAQRERERRLCTFRRSCRVYMYRTHHNESSQQKTYL